MTFGIQETRVCRFCKREELLDERRPLNRLIKYSTRGYAHGRCLANRVEIERMLTFRVVALEQLLAYTHGGQFVAVSQELERRIS